MRKLERGVVNEFTAGWDPCAAVGYVPTLWCWEEGPGPMLPAGVEADGVPLGVADEGDEAEWCDGELRPLHPAAGCWYS